MQRMGSVRILAVALVATLAWVLSASAQITTGTVAGTVKDAQGGVIPGATVTLISESRALTIRARKLAGVVAGMQAALGNSTIMVLVVSSPWITRWTSLSSAERFHPYRSALTRKVWNSTRPKPL